MGDERIRDQEEREVVGDAQGDETLDVPETGEPPLPTPSLDSFPGYSVIREIHRGGQGVVYRAVQKATKRKVAVKVMKEGPFSSRADRARFDREVQILGQLNHPNIVAIHDTGTAGGSHYFVMDYISGQPLDAHMASGEHSIDEALKLFARICDAVNAAHLHGVIHRDLKPGNIRIDPEGEPHILDFGLAKTATTEAEASLMTMTGQFVGSLPWASPEQAEAIPGKIDIRTDVYSLGVILYQMLTGRLPYEVVGNMRDVLDRIMRAEPARPSTIRKQIDDEVETIVLKCLSKERERRYQTAGELARDVGHYLSGEPIEAKRDSGWYVLRKQLRRYRTAVTVAVAFVLLLAAASVVSTVFYARAERTAARLETANGMLLDIVTALNPARPFSHGQGIRPAIDAASEKLDDGLLSADPETEARLRRLLAHTYFELSDYEAATVQLRQNLALHKAVALSADRPLSVDLAPDLSADAAVFESLYSLAFISAHQDHVEEAIQLFEDARIAGSKAFGEEHPYLLKVDFNLAVLGDNPERARAAIDAYPRFVDRQQAASDISEQEMGTRLVGIVQMLMWAGDRAEAEPYCRQLLASNRRTYGERHLFVGYASEWLALSLDAQGELAEAEVLLRRAATLVAESLYDDAPDVAHVLANLGRLLAEQGKHIEAERHLRKALAILEIQNPWIWLYNDARSTLGGVLAEQGRYSEAEPLLLQSCEELKKEPMAWPHRRREALDRVIRLYELWGKPEEASEWRDRSYPSARTSGS